MMSLSMEAGRTHPIHFPGWEIRDAFIVTHTQINVRMTTDLRDKEEPMFLAIAVESKQHPKNQNDYRVWYLEVDESGQVVNVGVKSKSEMVEHLFANYRRTGKSNWRAFQKGAEKSTPVEIFDFVSMNMHDNTHFGNLPSLSEFQTVLDTLQSRLELRSIA